MSRSQRQFLYRDRLPVNIYMFLVLYKRIVLPDYSADCPKIFHCDYNLAFSHITGLNNMDTVDFVDKRADTLSIMWQPC